MGIRYARDNIASSQECQDFAHSNHLEFTARRNKYIAGLLTVFSNKRPGM